MMPEFDSMEWREVRNKKLAEWVGNDEAIEFLLICFAAGEFFDDVVDGDTAIDSDVAISVLIDLTTKLPLNRFFEVYKLQLIPLMITGINAWQDANVLEKGTENDRAWAYVLRDWYMELLSFVVFLTRGQHYLREVSVEMRKFFSQHESLEQYKRKLV